MGIFEKATYALGILSIDDQHSVLIDLLQKLQNKEGNLELPELRNLLQELKDYARDHFTHEEECMKKSGYPDLVAHKKEHAAFVRHLAVMGFRLQNSSVLPASEIADFLTHWLLDHIGGRDRDYVPYLQKAGFL
ncbi:MAG: hemerythrin family protein [Spirochaetales bacterium]|nr:hemerythrin family protein [Spirochaetales bacterium]